MPGASISSTVSALFAALLTACSGVGVRGTNPGSPDERITPFALRAESAPPGLQLMRHGQLDEASVSRIEDPAQRGAMRMAQGLVHEDRRRMTRGFGEPQLDSWTLRECDHDRMLREDERRAEARAEHLGTIGPAMLRGPLRDALRELPITRDAEIAVDELCATHSPFLDRNSGAPAGPDRGRIAIRVRAQHPASGLELGYRYRDFHALSSAERLRVRFDVPLAERASARVAIAHHYSASRSDIRVELGWQIDPTTRLQVAVGNRIRSMPAPGYWSGADGAEETGSGMAFYVERVF